MLPTEALNIINTALAEEGVPDGNVLVVPEDFFDRLGAKLNPPGSRVLDLLIEKLCEPQSDEA
jgi:hypothetical protein